MKKVRACIKFTAPVFVLSLLTQTGMAQAVFEPVLQQIEQNNTGLAALRQQVEAEKIGNKTGIYLENPEVEFHYLWGNKNEIGDRVDFSATQRFDFPTTYHHKSRLSQRKNDQAEMRYQIERKNILLRTKQICIELAYYNALDMEYQKRLDHANLIAQAYQTQFDKGEANVLDRNKAQLNLLNARKATETNKANRDLLIAELTALNGGNRTSFDHSEFLPILLNDFESWYNTSKDKNLSLQLIQQEIELSKQNEKLQRSLNLPKFSAGYMSEKVMNDQFQGITVGVSIPLWENKNTVKHIKKQTQAYQQLQQDTELQSYNRIKAAYEKAQNLQKISNSYKTTLQNINNSELLKKALDKGEISLINYLTELGIYYDAINQSLETEKDFQLLAAELFQWEL